MVRRYFFFYHILKFLTFWSDSIPSVNVKRDKNKIILSAASWKTDLAEITNVSDEEMLKQGGRKSFIKSLMPTVDKHAIEYVNTMHNLENALKTGKIKQLTDEQKVWYEIAKEQSQKYM